MRNTCLEQIYELAKKDSRIVFIGSDLGAGTLQKFKDEMPERFFMEGIAEQNMIGMAAGMALAGKIVYVNTIATFLTRRAYEQIAIDVCLHNLNVRLIGNGGGLVYAPLGPTHLATDDLALMCALPNMTVIAPADAEEMKRLMPETVEHQGPIYIRLGKGGEPVYTPMNIPFHIGESYKIVSSTRRIIVTTGVMLGRALKFRNATVLHMPTLKPFWPDFLYYAERADEVIVIEEHVASGGLGSRCALALANARCNRRFTHWCLPDRFISNYGSQDEILNNLWGHPWDNY